MESLPPRTEPSSRLLADTWAGRKTGGSAALDSDSGREIAGEQVGAEEVARMKVVKEMVQVDPSR